MEQLRFPHYDCWWAHYPCTGRPRIIDICKWCATTYFRCHSLLLTSRNPFHLSYSPPFIRQQLHVHQHPCTKTDDFRCRLSRTSALHSCYLVAGCWMLFLIIYRLSCLRPAFTIIGHSLISVSFYFNASIFPSWFFLFSICVFINLFDFGIWKTFTSFSSIFFFFFCIILSPLYCRFVESCFFHFHLFFVFSCFLLFIFYIFFLQVFKIVSFFCFQ